MFSQTLYIQWKWNRDTLAFYTALAFSAPLLILWIALPHLGLSSARELVRVGEVVGITIAGIAVVAGLTVAWQGYGVDERAGHIYTLSLPVTRMHALALRAATALVILVIPAGAVWLGALLATGQVHLPPTLRGYAGTMALRALLASWLAHACMFAVRYSAGRRAKIVLGVLVALMCAASVVAITAPGTRVFFSHVGDFIISNPGPFGAIFGRWTLIDV